MDFYIRSVKNLNEAALTLEYFKDEPPVVLEAIDTDPLCEGVQIEQGTLGGVIQANKANNSTGVLEYQETNIGGLNSDRVKVASTILQVPEETYVTAMYLVPKCRLIDTEDNQIRHFMGGVKITIKKE